MARRSDHSREELKEMAITIAEQLVSREGLGGLSARKVAAEMEYTVGTLYLIFKNIDGLIIEVNIRTLKQLEAMIRKSVAAKNSPEEMICEIAGTYLNYARTRSKRWRAVFEHRLPEGELFPGHYHDQVNQLFALVEEPLRQIHANAASANDITREARALWAAVHGIATLTVGENLNMSDAEPEVILEMLVGRMIGIEKAGGAV